MAPTVEKISAGHYRVGDVDVVRIGRRWITRSAHDPRDTYDWHATMGDAVDALTAEPEPASAVVDIVDVVPQAIRVRADRLQVGDHVFDVWGSQHRLTRVTQRGGVVRTVRADGTADRWLAGETLTIVSVGATRN